MNRVSDVEEVDKFWKLLVVEGKANSFRGDKLGCGVVKGNPSVEPFCLGDMRGKRGGQLFEDVLVGNIEGDIFDNGLPGETMGWGREA